MPQRLSSAILKSTSSSVTLNGLIFLAILFFLLSALLGVSGSFTVRTEGGVLDLLTTPSIGTAIRPVGAALEACDKSPDSSPAGSTKLKVAEGTATVADVAWVAEVEATVAVLVAAVAVLVAEGAVVAGGRSARPFPFLLCVSSPIFWRGLANPPTFFKISGEDLTEGHLLVECPSVRHRRQDFRAPAHVARIFWLWPSSSKTTGALSFFSLS